MREHNTTNGYVTGAELYGEIQRLICEWRGSDAADQDAALPALVEKIVQLKQAPVAFLAKAATHDDAEAA